MLSLALFWFCCTMLISEGSFHPFPSLGRRPSVGSLLAADPCSEASSDPFSILEQLPLALERDESVALSPVTVDWKETPKGHVIMVDVPGLEKDQLKVEVEANRILRVSGERNRDQEDQKAAGDHWHRVESYGKFLRQFRLPENVDLDSVIASLQNGVLTISISKLSPDRIKGPKLVTIVGEEEATSSQLNSHVKEEL